MPAVSTFVYRHIPSAMRDRRDFTGPRGWVWLLNQLLRRLESESLISLTQLKEVGVLVSNKRWISTPSDFRKVEEVYYPGFNGDAPIRNMGYEIVNGKIHLDADIDLDAATTNAYTLSAGGTASIRANDAAATEDKWKDFLLVLTNGTYSGDCIIIGEHDAASAGTVTLNFLHARTTSVSGSTAGYLTDMYAMLRYWSTFTGLTAASDEIPVDDKFETALVAGLMYLASTDKDDRKQYRDEFEAELVYLGNEQNTPTADQARPVSRPMAALDADTADSDYEFVGDPDADLE